jgi:hypothetical protein
MVGAKEKNSRLFTNPYFTKFVVNFNVSPHVMLYDECRLRQSRRRCDFENMEPFHLKGKTG